MAPSRPLSFHPSGPFSALMSGMDMSLSLCSESASNGPSRSQIRFNCWVEERLWCLARLFLARSEQLPSIGRLFGSVGW